MREDYINEITGLVERRNNGKLREKQVNSRIQSIEVSNLANV